MEKGVLQTKQTICFLTNQFKFLVPNQLRGFGISGLFYHSGSSWRYTERFRSDSPPCRRLPVVAPSRSWWFRRKFGAQLQGHFPLPDRTRGCSPCLTCFPSLLHERFIVIPLIQIAKKICTEGPPEIQRAAYLQPEWKSCCCLTCCREEGRWFFIIDEEAALGHLDDGLVFFLFSALLIIGLLGFINYKNMITYTPAEPHRVGGIHQSSCD
jgi:hypothetical protein